MARARRGVVGCVTAWMACGLAACSPWMPDVALTPAAQGFRYGRTALEFTAEPRQLTLDCGHGDDGDARDDCGGGYRFELEFRDSEGRAVPGGGRLTAAGPVTLSVPPNAVSADWERSPLLPERAPRIERPGALELGRARWDSLRARGGAEHEFNSLPLRHSLRGPTRVYSVRARAGCKRAAHEQVAKLLHLGPGSELPGGVRVGVYIEAEPLGGELVIRSSLVDRFDEFRIELDGLPVAELRSGLNVSMLCGGAGWITVTARLPLSALPEQRCTLTLSQKGGNDTEAAQVSLSF